MTNPDFRPSVAPKVDPIELIERGLVTHRSAPGGKCATCGTLPKGMTTTRHRAIGVLNALEQAGMLRSGVV